MEDTQTQFTRNGSYVPERSALHFRVIEERLSGHESQDAPIALIVIGGPSSGKTTLIEKLGEPPDAVRINPDEVREDLPEYAKLLGERDPNAAALTHEEASDVAKMLALAAIQLRLNIVLDAVGSNEDGKLSKRLQTLIRSGYRVEIRCATINVDEAERREAKRSERTGRKVPREVLRDGHRKVSRGFPQLVDDVAAESVKVYDMSEQDPILIADGRGGEGLDGLEVVDNTRFGRFLRKGGS